MNIRKYRNLKKAIESLARENQNYVFVRHTLESGEEIRLHYHEKANEWIVIDNENETVVVYLPKRQKHSLLAKSKISYCVFRDREDETIYCEK